MLDAFAIADENVGPITKGAMVLGVLILGLCYWIDAMTIENFRPFLFVCIVVIPLIARVVAYVGVYVSFLRNCAFLGQSPHQLRGLIRDCADHEVEEHGTSLDMRVILVQLFIPKHPPTDSDAHGNEIA